MKNYINILLVLLISTVISVSQTEVLEQPDYVTNGAFKKDYNQNKEKAFAYPPISQKDVVWSKTVWRSIDLRQKMNHHFYFPAIENRPNLNPDKMSLIDVVMEALRNHANEQINNSGGANVMSNTGPQPRLDCFRPGFGSVPGNEFKYGTFTPEEILVLGVEKSEKVAELNEDGDDSTIYNATTDRWDTVWMQSSNDAEFNRTKVDEWLIKEEWYFDKRRSKMQVRIIGLCPVYTYEDPITLEIARKKLFWIYFDDFRDILLNTRVTNYTKNNSQERSFLGIFEKRMFASRITMENNIMNREISDYMIGLDALLESDRIQEEIFNIEHDLWEY